MIYVIRYYTKGEGKNSLIIQHNNLCYLEMEHFYGTATSEMKKCIFDIVGGIVTLSKNRVKSIES